MEQKEEIAQDADADAQEALEQVVFDSTPYVVAGPSTSFVVVGTQYIRALIIAACHVNGDREEDYTWEPTQRVTCTPVPRAVEFCHRDHNTTLH